MMFQLLAASCFCGFVSTQVFLQILGVIAVASSVIPWILIPVVPLLGVFLYLRRYFLQTSRDVKRLESTSEWTECHVGVLFSVPKVAASLKHLSVPQLGVPSSPTCPPLFRACGPSEPSEPRRGSRKPSTLIRTCTQVRPPPYTLLTGLAAVIVTVSGPEQRPGSCFWSPLAGLPFVWTGCAPSLSPSPCSAACCSKTVRNLPVFVFEFWTV